MRTTRLKRDLGSDLPTGGRQITIFIPDRNQHGKPIAQEFWTDEALSALGGLFRGATAFPPERGVWRDDLRGGILLKEITVMVTSYVPEKELLRNARKLRNFLHRFGRQANQGEVGIIAGGVYYGISKFDPE